MKRLSLCILVLALASSASFAQENEADRPDADSLPFGDARAYGLAGAMTAVNDDMNTLFFNPAGLSFLRRNYFTVETSLGTSSYTYVGDGSGSATGGPYYAPYIVQPKLVAGGKGWGVALTADYLAYADNGWEYSADVYNNDTSLRLPAYVAQRIGAVAGLGLNLGPLAVGANLKYYGYSAIYDFETCPAAQDWLGWGEQILFGSGFAIERWKMGVGLGALFTLGNLNLGAYYDNMMPFINAMISGEDYSLGAYALDCFKTMSLGLSFMPSDDKFAKAKSPIDLILSLDLKNLGDNENRQLCAGAEAGIDLWNFLVATARVGYKQALPTDVFSFGALVDAFNLDNGEVSAGVTAKFAFAKADLTLMLPLDKVESTYAGVIADWTEIKMRATIALCL